MSTNQKLLDEILNSASKIPLEGQERILDMIKAMIFTREVVQKEKEENKE